VPVSILVLDAPGQGAPYETDGDYDGYAIRSDGAAYQDGVNRVDARVQRTNCTHDLWMGLGLSSRRMLLYQGGVYTGTLVSFNFDRVGSVPLTTDTVAMGTYCGLAENYGGCDTDASDAQYVRRAVTLQWELGSNDVLKLQRTPEDIATYENFPELRSTSWVRVYHPDPYTYVLSPEPVALNSAVAAHLFSTRKDGRKFKEYVQLPFRIIVTTSVPLPAPEP